MRLDTSNAAKLLSKKHDSTESDGGFQVSVEHHEFVLLETSMTSELPHASYGEICLCSVCYKSTLIINAVGHEKRCNYHNTSICGCIMN